VLLCGSITTPAAATIRGAERVTQVGSSSSASPKSDSAFCPAGKTALAGGSANSGTLSDLSIATSVPVIDLGSGDPIGWFAENTEIFPTSNGWAVVARVLCGAADGVELVDEISDSTSDSKTVEVECPPGKSALSGGFELLGSTQGVGLNRSEPLLDDDTGLPIGWRAGAFEAAANSGNWSLRVDAICADEDVFAFQVRESFASQRYTIRDLECPQGWIATGGGAQAGGVDWIDESAPGFPLSIWDLRLQRELAETTQVTHVLHVLCPEPGALASAATALGVVALRRRR
jgi:hypothetical protein